MESVIPVSYTHLDVYKRQALHRVSEFLGIKKRLLDIRENVRGAIKITDKDIAKTALLAKGFREAGQTAANAFRDLDCTSYILSDIKKPFLNS